jgi:hypothetical protein
VGGNALKGVRSAAVTVLLWTAALTTLVAFGAGAAITVVAKQAFANAVLGCEPVGAFSGNLRFCMGVAPEGGSLPSVLRPLSGLYWTCAPAHLRQYSCRALLLGSGIAWGGARAHGHAKQTLVGWPVRLAGARGRSHDCGAVGAAAADPYLLPRKVHGPHSGCSAGARVRGLRWFGLSKYVVGGTVPDPVKVNENTSGAPFRRT